MKSNHRYKIRILLSLFMAGLVLSGLTAFALETEFNWLISNMDNKSSIMTKWLIQSREGIHWANENYPFLSYGTDWLAFAHIVIAVAFIGPWKDPVKNIWVIKFGIIACAGIIPLALIAGPIRQIPTFWIAIDCSFAVIGCIPLIWALVLTKRMIADLSIN